MHPRSDDAFGWAYGAGFDRHTEMKLKPKRLLNGSWRLDMNTLELEHAHLGRRAARRRKATDLAAGRQDPVARNDQRHRIVGHGFTDVARGLWPGANLLCQSAIGGRMTPSNLPSRSIDLVEERALLIEVELEL